MATRLDLRNTIRTVLTNNLVFPDDLLNQLIGDAIRDYSLFFPRESFGQIECVNDKREYGFAYFASSAQVMSIVSVEYPRGLTPKEFLYRLPRRSALFLDGPYYDVDAAEATLFLGKETKAGEYVGVVYNTSHATPLVDGSTLSVPDMHVEVLKLYVVWQACERLEMNNAMTTDGATNLLNMLGLNGYRAERAYRNRLKELRESASKGGYGSNWVMDKWDGGY
jgi:hypothetical protein